MFLPCSRHREHLLSAQVVTIQTVQQVFQGNESLCINKASNNCSNIMSSNSLQLLNQTDAIQGSLGLI